MNEDGYPVRGSDVIYAPKGQAGEYSNLATNPYRGCGHACVYCYVPAVIHMRRQDFDAGATPRPGFLDRVKKDAAKYREHGITEQVMLSFTTDPYHAGDTGFDPRSSNNPERLRDGFCKLTKGEKRALRDLDLFRPDRDAFASTLTNAQC